MGEKMLATSVGIVGIEVALLAPDADDLLCLLLVWVRHDIKGCGGGLGGDDCAWCRVGGHERFGWKGGGRDREKG